MKTFALIVLVAFLAAGCGGGSKASSAFRLGPTKQCTKTKLGVTTFPSIANDFVASTASGGAFRMRLGSLNDVTLLFGQDASEANNLADAYRRFRAENVGIEDILRTNDNVVLLWKYHPNTGDELNVNGCLR